MKKESSTTAALNSLTDDGQAATCPKCCVIRDFLKCSKNNLKSQANLDTYFLAFNIPSKSNSGRGTLAPRSKREVPSSTTTLDPRIKREAIALDPLLPIMNCTVYFLEGSADDEVMAEEQCNAKWRCRRPVNVITPRS